MRKFIFCLMVMVAVAIAGCSGDTVTPLPPTKITGVAAAGSPLQGTVYLKDATSHDLSTPIADDGSFSFDIAGLQKPFLLKATGSANGRSYVLYSVSREGGVANINPLSSLVVADAAGGDAKAVFEASDRAPYTPLAGGLASSLWKAQRALAELLKAFDVATVNPITDSYLANHSGLDRLFDVVSIDAANGRVAIINKLNDAVILDAPVTAMTTAALATGNIPRMPQKAARKWHLKRSVEETTDAAQNPLETTATSYSYDPAGNVTAVSQTVTAPGSASPAAAVTSYGGFDSHGNPAIYTGPQDGGSMAYEYDASGRIVKKTGTVTASLSTGRGYYTLTYTSTYSYNPDGSYTVKTLSTKTYGTGLEVGVSDSHEYDSRGNLLSYSTNGEKVLSYNYLYDANGNAVTGTFLNSAAGTRGTATYQWEYF